MLSSKFFLPLSLIFILGVALRILSFYPSNIIFDYDQVEDLFHTRKILMGDLTIIGRPVYGLPNLHHGVFFYYYNLLPFILFQWNPQLIALWHSVLNSALSFLIFFFARSLFKSTTAGFISVFITAVSYEFIQFSSWITIISPALISVPAYFFGLWKLYQKRDWGLVLTAIALGISIQLDLMFVYLIPTFCVFWFVMRLRFPQVKTILLSFLLFLISISTMILTEIKLNFAGVNTLVHFSDVFDDSKISYAQRLKLFLDQLSVSFAHNILPQKLEYGTLLVLAVISVVILSLLSKQTDKKIKDGLLFSLLFLFSPLVMLVFGFHRQPWFLIGIQAAVVILGGYAISRLKHLLVILAVLTIIGLSNLQAILKNRQTGPPIFQPEVSSLLSSQLAVVDYTYTKSQGQPFAINSVTYPLYDNAIWEYHYKWYGQNKYGFLPGWLGGEQLPLYKTLPPATGNEKYFFMIIDNTYRIPEVYKLRGKEWANSYGPLIEEKEIDGFTVQKRGK